MQQARTLLLLGLCIFALSLCGCGVSDDATDAIANGGICGDHADCPASQVCSEGSCVATCLNATICPSTGTISGALQIESSAAVGESDLTVIARASFIQTEMLSDPQWVVFPGTDCVALKNELLGMPCGLSVGDIRMKNLHKDGSEDMAFTPQVGEAAILEANQTGDGIHYSARKLDTLSFANDQFIQALAPGGDLPGFNLFLSIPTALQNVQVESANGLVVGEDFTLTWTPGDSAQILVKLDALATPLEESVPTTIICPARDEAGTLTIPGSATGILDGEFATIRIERRNITMVPYTGTALPATITQTLSWQEPVEDNREDNRQ